jgi:hypothetical protein
VTPATGYPAAIRGVLILLQTRHSGVWCRILLPWILLLILLQPGVLLPWILLRLDTGHALDPAAPYRGRSLGCDAAGSRA